MSANARQLKDYLKSWNQYRHIWENNKDYIMQKYKTANKSVSAFDADIQRFRPCMRSSMRSGFGFSRC
ncbi:hypothetical protein XENOCAPTIV_026893 [Xenoophorus captivus]|uniref:MADF domain-containing protein n=1 Tax=Xenoophorus captivus TaxID=1517983 RepID=A0ABV0RS85_9TELE